MSVQSGIRRRPGPKTLRARQRLGKYRIERRLAEGGFAHVYRAYDTIEGVHVALKVPHRHLGAPTLDDLCREVRLSAKLTHPNILSIKNAGFLEGLFVIVYPLGRSTLAERLGRRVATDTMIAFSEQIVSAVSHAHERRIIHCDLKPENFILFDGQHLKLTDFGIARVALRTRTLDELGAGTIGYVAPEQALGKPSFPSDVFSLGLILYRMWSGQLPSWPYLWPPPGIDRLREQLHPDFIALLRRCLAIHERERFPDAVALAQEFEALRTQERLVKRTRRRTRSSTVSLEGRAVVPCGHCGWAISRAWDFCAWCGAACQPARRTASR